MVRSLCGVLLAAIVLSGCATVGSGGQVDQLALQPEAVTAMALPEIDAPDAQVEVAPLPEAELPPDSVLFALAEIAEEEEEVEAQLIGSGKASYYGHRFAGRRTASGERFDPGEWTAAHRTLPFGSVVRVTNLANGKSVVVRINDRGPFTHNRVIDLSYAAAQEIGMIRSGIARVQLELLPESGDETAAADLSTR